MSIPGSNIRTLRMQMGLSVRALARAAEMDNGNLSKLEAGKIGYSEETIQRLAKILHVTYSTLFADPDELERAALKARPVPVLECSTLKDFRGPDDAEFSDDQQFVWLGLDLASRHSFALIVKDDANHPLIEEGDTVVFDPKVMPKPGQFVAVQSGKGDVFLGRLRRLPKEGFEVVPLRFETAPIISTALDPKAWLRGTAVELRRSILTRI